MERPCGSGHASPSNVPSFLNKLWKLVDDPATDALISWSPSGNSFLVFDQVQFATDLLPLYFKHNHMASFIRQLNMYGFHKVVRFPQGLIKRAQRDPIEYQHPDFLRGREQLLENIKRKVSSASGVRAVEAQRSSVSGLCQNVQVMKEKQENVDLKLNAMKYETDTLRTEVTTLQQKQAQQQRVVSKLAGFLMTLAKSNQFPRIKSKVPQLLNGSPLAHSPPKCCCRDYFNNVLDNHAPGTSSSDDGDFNLSSAANVGPVVTNMMELSQPSPRASAESSAEEPTGVMIYKKEPSSPLAEGSPEMEEPGAEFANSFRYFPPTGQPSDDAPAFGVMGGDDPAPRQPASE